MPARKSALVIDANNLIVRAIYASALDDLRAGRIFTGGVFGALGTLRSLVKDPGLRETLGPIVACFDHGVPPKRMRLLPDYKQARREANSQLSDADKEKAMSQISTCWGFWPHLGVQCLAYRDREADDVCAAVARLYLDEDMRVVVASSDRDLFQMVAWGIEVFDLRSNQFVTKATFDEHSGGVPLDQWLLYRALVGDASDGIRGVPGCGPKRAKQLLQEVDFEEIEPKDNDDHGKLRHLCAHVRDRVRQAKKPRAFERNLLDNEEHLGNVLRAIDLRVSFGPVRKLQKRLKEPPAFDSKSFLRRCKDLQFGSVLGDPLGTLDPFRACYQRR